MADELISKLPSSLPDCFTEDAVKNLYETIHVLNHENSQLKNDLQQALNELQWIKDQLKLGQQHTFSKSTEKQNAYQMTLLGLFDEDSTVTESEPEDKSSDITVNTHKRKKKKIGRNIDTSQLPRIQQIHDLTEAEKHCQCGCELTKIGEDISEQLDFQPAKLTVVEHIRPKYACRSCQTVRSAPKPSDIPITKCMAGASLIAEIIIEKYEHHIPLYRQSKRFLTYDIKIPDNTLGNWVMRSAELLTPLYDALWLQFKSITVLQADETPVKILKPDKKGFMWVYHSYHQKNKFAVFEFSLTRSAHVVNKRLINYKGILQTDGYYGYNELRKKDSVINIGCWDHCRRKFMDIIKVNSTNKTSVAVRMIQMMSKLYYIERKSKRLNAKDRCLLRMKKAQPILDNIYQLAINTNAPPKSLLGKAITYLKNQWLYLSAYIHHGQAQMSNCWVENLIRPFAVGRKNWLFVGNEASGKKAALLYSLIQTCKLNDINAKQYFIYVLKQVQAMRRGEINPVHLLPQFIDKKAILDQK